MAFYRSLGSVPPKRHTQHRTRSGSLYYEELTGEEGFSSDSSLLYHSGVPSAIVDATPWDLPEQVTRENRPLKPRHLKLHDLTSEDWKAVDAATGRLVLGNGDVRIAYVAAAVRPPAGAGLNVSGLNVLQILEEAGVRRLPPEGVAG